MEKLAGGAYGEGDAARGAAAFEDALVVLDNLTGHKTPELLLWMFARGITWCSTRR
jgi:hypothetical protein